MLPMPRESWKGPGTNERHWERRGGLGEFSDCTSACCTLDILCFYIMIVLPACFSLQIVFSSEAIPVLSPRRIVSKGIAKCTKRTMERVVPETR